MKKKVLFLPLFCLLIAACVIAPDLRSCAAQTETVSSASDGLLFSITTFDGKSESEPFVKCLGHTWLSLENQTGHSVFLKEQELRPGESVTFSVWAISDHYGVVFNLEPAFIRDFGRYAGRESLSVGICESQLGVIEDYIDSNDRWTLGKNCSYWSVQLWNAVVEKTYRLEMKTLVYTPKKLRKSLREFSASETDMDFPCAGGIWFYQNGQKTELELCSGKTE